MYATAFIVGTFKYQFGYLVEEIANGKVPTEELQAFKVCVVVFVRRLEFFFQQDEFGVTALDFCTDEDPNLPSETLATTAASYGNHQAAQHLWRIGADMDHPNPRGYNPLHAALLGAGFLPAQSALVVERLLECAVDPNKLTGCGTHPLALAEQSKSDTCYMLLSVAGAKKPIVAGVLFFILSLTFSTLLFAASGVPKVRRNVPGLVRKVYAVQYQLAPTGMYRVRKSRKYKQLCSRIKRNILDMHDLREFVVTLPFLFLSLSLALSLSHCVWQWEFGLVALKTRDVKTGKTLLDVAVDSERSKAAELISDFQSHTHVFKVYRKKDYDIHY